MVKAVFFCYIIDFSKMRQDFNFTPHFNLSMWAEKQPFSSISN